MLKKIGVTAKPVLTDQDINSVEGIILPGGESTTIGKLLRRYGLVEVLQKFSKSGKPIFGTCAGMILLAHVVQGQEKPWLDLLDITAERNAYGRQLESFEAEVDWKDGTKSPGIFIRAPKVVRLGQSIQVLAERENVPVLIQNENILAASFHPELTEDERVHRWFLNMVGKK